MTRTSFSLICVFVMGSLSALAFSPIKSGHKKLSSYIREGAIVGGKSTGDYSLLNIRRHFLKKKGMERIVFDMGDERGAPLLNSVNYYHISYSGNEIRVYFPRLAKYGLSLRGMESRLTQSKFIEKARVISNPKERSTSLILSVVPGVEMEVFHLPSKKKAARIVLDLIGKIQ